MNDREKAARAAKRRAAALAKSAAHRKAARARADAHRQKVLARIEDRRKKATRRLQRPSPKPIRVGVKRTVNKALTKTTRSRTIQRGSSKSADVIKGQVIKRTY